MLIFVAISGSSFRFCTVNDRPPVISVKSYKKGRARLFLRRRAAVGFKKPDGIYLNIGFLHELPDVRFAVTTVIIAPIRYDEQSFLCVVCSFHLAQAEINAVVKSRQSVGGGVHQAILQVRPRCR